jgi:flagellar hook assembly protein FlgD
VDGELSGSSISYTIKASDVGKDIRAEISGTNTVGKAISEIVRAAGGANPIIDIKNPDKRGGIRLSSNIVSEKAVITIDLPNNERVSQMKAVVYDNTGNEVFETEARGGTAEWDLTNNDGRNAANGSYLIIVEARGNNAKTYKYSAKLGVKR